MNRLIAPLARAPHLLIFLIALSAILKATRWLLDHWLPVAIVGAVVIGILVFLAKSERAQKNSEKVDEPNSATRSSSTLKQANDRRADEVTSAELIVRSPAKKRKRKSYLLDPKGQESSLRSLSVKEFNKLKAAGLKSSPQRDKRETHKS